MKLRNPRVRSCTSRIIRRCSIRSALVSPVPIMNVAVDSTPRPCAISMISSQRSPDEDLGTGAGERVEAGGADPRDRLLDADVGDLGHVLHLGRTEGVDGQL